MGEPLLVSQMDERDEEAKQRTRQRPWHDHGPVDSAVNELRGGHRVSGTARFETVASRTVHTSCSNKMNPETSFSKASSGGGSGFFDLALRR